MSILQRIMCCLVACMSCVGCTDPRIAALRSEDPRVRVNACRRFIADPESSPQVVAALLTCASDAEPQVRSGAIEALGQLRTAAESAYPTLVKALRDSEPLVQVSAAMAMLAIDPSRTEPRPFLISQIRARNPHVIQAIGQLGPAGDWAIPEIREVLNDRRENFRELAMITLQQLSGSSDTVANRQSSTEMP